MAHIILKKLGVSGGVCVPCCYFGQGGAISNLSKGCPQKIQVVCQRGGRSGDLLLTAFGYARCDSGGACGGGTANPYLTFGTNGSGDYFCNVDVWKAYKDGKWTSSTVIQVYRGNNFGTTATTNGTVAILNVPTGVGCPTTLTKAFGVDDLLPFCSQTLKMTITFLDDGTYTLT